MSSNVGMSSPFGGMMQAQQQPLQQSASPMVMNQKQLQPGAKSGFQAGTDDPFAGLEAAPPPAATASSAQVPGGDGGDPLLPAGSASVLPSPTMSALPSPTMAGDTSLGRPAATAASRQTSAPPVISPRGTMPASMSASPGVAMTGAAPPTRAVPAAVRSPSPATTTAAAPSQRRLEIPAPSEMPATAAAVTTPRPAVVSPRPVAPAAATTPQQPPNLPRTPPRGNVEAAPAARQRTPPRPSAAAGHATPAGGRTTPPRTRSATPTVDNKAPPSRTTGKAAGGAVVGIGIGKSGARLPESASPASTLLSGKAADQLAGVGNTRFFNIYEFLAGADKKEPSRKFYPIERVKPFWALMGLDVYVEKWRNDGYLKGKGKARGWGAGMVGALQGGGGVGNDGGNKGGGAGSNGKGDGKESASGKADGAAPAAFTAAPLYEQLSKAISFQCHLVQESERNMYSTGGKSHPLAHLRGNQIGLEACIKLVSMLPHSAGASGKNLDALFLNFINTYVNLVGNLQVGQQLVLPGGWQQPDAAHVCLYILRNRGSTFSFSVVNTGPDGLEYHPSNFDNTTGRQTKQLCLTIWDIPPERVTDSTFWALLFRMQVYPSKRNNAEFLYTKLLTSLNSRPLLSNKDAGPADFYYPPATLSSAHQFHQLALLALTTIPELNSPNPKYSQLLVRNSAVEIAYRGIADARPSSMDPEDSRILQLTARNLANYASTLDPTELGIKGNGEEGMNSLGGALSYTWDLLDRLLAKLSVASSKPLDQHSVQIGAAVRGGGEELNDFRKGLLRNLKTNEGSASHPYFGRLRRDNYDEVVKALMVRTFWQRTLSTPDAPPEWAQSI